MPQTAARPVSAFQQGVEAYATHLQRLEDDFNNHARDVGLGVLISVTDTINAARNGMLLDRVASFFNREDDSGVLHDAQMKTAVDCMLQLLDSPGQNGVVLGAMQSGKTTTSLALQFAGPVIYALTGRQVYPIYLTTSHTSQEDQTQIELLNFLSFYGTIKVHVDPNGRREFSGELDPGFAMSPTINYYRTQVLREALGDIHLGPQPDDFVRRRVHGQRLNQIAELCGRAHGQGFEPLLMIDEPQYGASDRIVTDSEGNQERRSCVLVRIFDAINSAMGGGSGRHSFIGLSATPYETHELESLWVVRQYLTPAYRGFNYFGRRTISDDVEIEPPETLGFSGLARRFDIPMLARIRMGTYNASPAQYPAQTHRVGYTGTQENYQSDVRAAMRAAILRMVAEANGEPIGICVRPFNNNARSADFVRRLDLESAGIEVIPFFGSEFSGSSVKRAISGRAHKDRPFVIVVTNRARMGDAFPAQVRWFVDLAARASDLNALLQGLLGRACGYNKNSIVVLSDENEGLVDTYRATRGGYFAKTSRHSIVVGGFRRGAPTNLIRVDTSMDDPIVREFFRRVDEEIVVPNIIQGSATLQPTRNRSGAFRTGPILRIAQETGLFEHLENRDVTASLFPNFPTQFRIVRADQSARHSRDPNRCLSYTLDENGNCRYTFRWTPADGSDTHTGLASRGYGARDATDRARAADGLEPQIHLEKYNAETGEAFFDKREPIKRTGDWRVRMITLPLVEPVREIREGVASMPNERSVYRRHMTAEEEQVAGFDD